MNPLPFERLDWMDDLTPRNAALNMALDETLLSRPLSDPLLRVYRWSRPSVSIGYFEAYAPVCQRWRGRELVRRWTGGGVVEHGDDVTFSLLVARPHPLSTLPADESYRLIHDALGHALERCGLPLATPPTGAVMPEGARSRACFERPVRHDLLLEGRKIAGGAQRRTRRGLLHQGSVQQIDATVRANLVAALPQAFGRCVNPRQITAEEIAAAESLVAAKYGTAAWQRRF